MTLFGKNTTFDKLLDKATSHLLLEPDWASNMNVCDMVRQGEINAKYAIAAVKKKLAHSNPHVVIYSLNLIEAMAKNCGASVHDEIATQDFMSQMKSLVKEKDPVKSKALELIQLWAHAFRHQSKYIAIQNTFNSLKSSGNSFPTLIESDAMFASENAPEWQDSDSCCRCKTPFTTLKRKVSLLDKITRSSNVKHHCRNCGNIFCDECSSKRSNIPKYGIEKDVRVCESCYELIKGGSTGTRPMPVKKGGHVQFNDDVAVRNFPTDAKDSDSEMLRAQKEKELELQEKEELELALALSASEAESHDVKKGKSTPKAAEHPTPNNQSGFNSLYSTLDTSEMDPELARYLNRNYWENKASETNSIKTTLPSAPIMPNSPNKMSQSNYIDSPGTSIKTKSGTVSLKESEVSAEQEEFLSALKSSIEIFVNRMRSNQQRGRSIAHDSAVQTLFLTLNAMQPQLLQYINEQDDQRTYFETLQDKLAQLRESREALDALREEHRDKRRREEEEAARIRQIQMMQKLEVMRQKKQEFLDYQRQLAVDRMQQQEREMAARLQQQRQLMQTRQYQQQYPYSMQHPMNPSDSSVQSLPNNMPQYNPMLANVPPGVPMDQYGGYPMMNQYGQVPPTTADYYNMQSMNQSLMNSGHGPEMVGGGAGQTQMNYMTHVNNTNPNLYPMPPQSQPMPNNSWDAHNAVSPASQPPPSSSSTGNMVPGGSRDNSNREKKEDQLISFD